MRDVPTIRLKNAWHSSHPWIYQRLVEKPKTRIKPGTIVAVRGVDDQYLGQGFYNGHSRIAIRLLDQQRQTPLDEVWFAGKLAQAVALRRTILQLDRVSDAWRVVHSEGDGLSGLVVDRYGQLLVVEFFSAGMFRHREWIYAALRHEFPQCQIYAFAEEHVQKQESFDCHQPRPISPVTITEHHIRFQVDPVKAHKTGFFTDQRDNRHWLSPFFQGQSVLDLCCNTGGFAVYAAVNGASSVIGLDIDQDVIDVAQMNARLNHVRPRWIHADLFAWLRDAISQKMTFDLVILDPSKMTRDRQQVTTALKKYLDMNKLALSVVKSGGLFASFSCTGLVSEQQFLDMVRRAAFYAGRVIQICKISGAGPDHPFLAHVPESRYLKGVFCRVL